MTQTTYAFATVQGQIVGNPVWNTERNSIRCQLQTNKTTITAIISGPRDIVEPLFRKMMAGRNLVARVKGDLLGNRCPIIAIDADRDEVKCFA